MSRRGPRVLMPRPARRRRAPDQETSDREISALGISARVRGRVGEELADALGLAAEVKPVETVLRGPVTDQDGLYGLLDQLQDVGLELIEIRRLPQD